MIKKFAELKMFVEKRIENYEKDLEEIGYFDDDRDIQPTFENGRLLGAYEILLTIRKFLSELEEELKTYIM